MREKVDDKNLNILNEEKGSSIKGIEF
jgi:hypothetical protein